MRLSPAIATALLLTVSQLGACDAIGEAARFERAKHEVPTPTPPIATPLTTAMTTEAQTRELVQSAETRQTLVVQSNRSRRFVPTEAPPCRLAFFGSKLARLTRSGLHISRIEASAPSSVKTSSETFNIDGPREMARLADNSLLIIAKNETLVVRSDERPRTTLAKVTYFPGMRLWSDLRFPGAFSMLDTNAGVLSTYRWELDPDRSAASSPGRIWLPDTTTEQPTLAGALCTLLPDGAYACLGHDGLYHGFPGYPAKRLGPIAAGATVVRLLPALRADRVLVLRSDGRLSSHWAITPPRVLGTIELPWMPFDVVTSKGSIFTLTLDQHLNEPHAFRLVGLDPEGQVSWETPLDTVELSLPSDDFQRSLGECRQLAVHASQPWLAVSDCEKVRLFELSTGKELTRIENVRY